MIPHPLGREAERDAWGNLPGHSYCHCHNADEPVPEEVYQVCFECGHVYAKATDLEEAYTREASIVKAEETWLRMTPPTIETRLPADRIPFCQECLHDF